MSIAPTRLNSIRLGLLSIIFMHSACVRNQQGIRFQLNSSIPLQQVHKHTHRHTHKYTPIHTHTHTSTDKHIHSASAFFSYISCEKFAEFAEFCLKFARAEAVAYESRVRRGKSLENNMKSALSACVGALKEANKFYEISYFHNSKANFFEPRIFFALQSSQGKCL